MDIKLIESNEIFVEQLSDEWFELRVGKITGSKLMDLMPTPKARKEWTDKQLDFLKGVASEILTGVKEGFNSSKSMEWGVETEVEARSWYELKTMDIVRECGFFKVNDYFGVSPDGIIESKNKIWECKCPNSKTHMSYLLNPESLYKKYKWQVIGEMVSSGLESAVIVSYDPRFLDDDKKMVMYETVLTDEDKQQLNDRINKSVEIIEGFIND